MQISDDTPPVQPGDVLAGKYRVERVLGAGGMGVVVAAMHMELERRVALKFLLPSTLANTVAVGRFAQEARAVVRLKSEHVARVIDVGRLESGAPYIVMEYLEGRDLGTLLEQGPLPVADAVDYVLQACEAVAEAHSLGIIHRDLKPRNMFVTAGVDGRPLVKVLDFGISKFTSPAGGAAQSQPQMSLTKTHEIMGSPMYMSPEQLRSSRAVDERSDIWSMGVILYEMLTGRVPFEADSVTELCAMLLQDTPAPVGQLRPDTPPGVAAAIDRCLQKHPDARFASVGDLAQALAPFGPADAREQAERVRTIRSGRARMPSLPEASGPVSRVAVTGGTSVSWGETQLAPLRQKRARTVSVIAGAIGLCALLVAFVAWRAHGSGSNVSAISMDPSARPAVAGAIASSALPALPGAMATTVTTAPPEPAATAPMATLAPIPAGAPPRTPPNPRGAGPRTKVPAAPAPPTTPPANQVPAHPATPTPPTPPPAPHPPADLPNERE